MNSKVIPSVILALFLFGAVSHADQLSVDEKVREMARSLKLTKTQVREIRPIIQEYKDGVSHLKEVKDKKLRRVFSVEQRDIYRKLEQENGEARGGP